MHGNKSAAFNTNGGNLALVDHHFDGLEAAPGRPIIADPQSIALSRAFAASLSYDSGLCSTLGIHFLPPKKNTRQTVAAWRVNKAMNRDA